MIKFGSVSELLKYRDTLEEQKKEVELRLASKEVKKNQELIEILQKRKAALDSEQVKIGLVTNNALNHTLKDLADDAMINPELFDTSSLELGKMLPASTSPQKEIHFPTEGEYPNTKVTETTVIEEPKATDKVEFPDTPTTEDSALEETYEELLTPRERSDKEIADIFRKMLDKSPLITILETLLNLVKFQPRFKDMSYGQITFKVLPTLLGPVTYTPIKSYISRNILKYTLTGNADPVRGMLNTIQLLPRIGEVEQRSFLHEAWISLWERRVPEGADLWDIVDTKATNLFSSGLAAANSDENRLLLKSLKGSGFCSKSIEQLFEYIDLRDVKPADNSDIVNHNPERPVIEYTNEASANFKNATTAIPQKHLKKEAKENKDVRTIEHLNALAKKYDKNKHGKKRKY